MVACGRARDSSSMLSHEGPSPSAEDRPTLWNLDRRTIERETRYLYAYSMKLLHDSDLAQDAVQETLLTGLKYAESFDGRPSILKTGDPRRTGPQPQQDSGSAGPGAYRNTFAVAIFYVEEPWIFRTNRGLNAKRW